MHSCILTICYSMIILNLNHGIYSLPISATKALPPETRTLSQTTRGILLPATTQSEGNLINNLMFNIIMVSTVVALLAISVCLCAIKYRHKGNPLRHGRRVNLSQETLIPNSSLEQSDKLQEDSPPPYEVIIVETKGKKPNNFVLPPSYVDALQSTEVKTPIPEIHTHI